VTAEIWSLGHRNPLGLAFDPQDRLWNSEMGPLHGDELNLVVKGDNSGNSCNMRDYHLPDAEACPSEVLVKPGPFDTATIQLR
jgi:hypothetical protein